MAPKAPTMSSSSLSGKNGKKKCGSEAPSEESKRSNGSTAVSQQFLPKKQQNATNTWRKQEDNGNAAHAYVPFKLASTTAPLPIYGVRGNNSQMLSPSDYLHATYAPPHVFRPNSAAALNCGETMPANAMRNESRPGSEMGMYNPSSRYQSYTTLPRPEQVEVCDDFQTAHRLYNQHVQKQQEIYGALAGKPAARIPSTQQSIYGSAVKVPFRPPSAMSLQQQQQHHQMSYNSSSYLPNPVMFTEESKSYPIQQLEQQGLKEIVDWSSLNLSCCLQVLFGSCIFALGVARMFLRADYARGQELFYGISVVCAGLFGYFGVRHRSYCLAVAAYVLSVVNAALVAVPFLSGLLPLIPMLSSASGSSGTYISLNRGPGNNEPVEVDLALTILSLLEFAAAIYVAVHGCRTAGTVIRHVETLRLDFVSTGKAAPQSHEPYHNQFPKC